MLAILKQILYAITISNEHVMHKFNFIALFHMYTATPAPPNIGSCPSGPTRMRSYIRAHHTRLCRYTCSFGVAAQG